MRRLLPLLLLTGLAASEDVGTLVRDFREGSVPRAAAAAIRLRRLGRCAWPALARLRHDRDPDVRRRARGLLKRISSDWWGVPAEDATFDEKTSLPRRVVHRATGIEMVLLPRADGRGHLYVGRTEVTQGQYRKGLPDGYYFAPPSRDRYPATGMSWNGIQRFLERNGLRLLTEAEWELYAKDAEVEWHGPACRPAGAGKPNTLRLFDMADNAAEWCTDVHGEKRAARGGKERRRLLPADHRSDTIGFRVARAPD